MAHKKYKLVARKLAKGEKSTKKCAGCRDSYVPEEYELCDYCLVHGFFGLSTTTNPCSDPLGMVDLVKVDDVIPVLRNLMGTVYVKF